MPQRRAPCCLTKAYADLTAAADRLFVTAAHAVTPRLESLVRCREPC
jgi:hypothetical protein